MFTPTPSQTAGPFLHLGLTDHRSISRMAGEGVKGELIALTVRLLDSDGDAIPDAMIELWQADSSGNYANSSHSAPRAFNGFGRMATGEDGACTFETIMPGRVPGPEGTLQAPHINLSILGRGIQKRLATRVYFERNAANNEDPILALVPKDRRTTLLARSDPGRAGGWVIEIRLRGTNETVFFDV